MSELIIKSEKDLKNHFEWHDQEKEKWMKLRSDFEGDYNSSEFKELESQQEKSFVFFGEFGLSGNEINMYYGHEGDVLTNVQFCPFCGIHFKVVVD